MYIQQNFLLILAWLLVLVVLKVDATDAKSLASDVDLSLHTDSADEKSLVKAGESKVPLPFLHNSKLKIAYGSMLNITCASNDDCWLKNSICNSLTKRCDCDFGTMHDNSRCEVIACSSSNECLDRFPNTVCMFGRCQCRFGLKANGQCVKLEMEGTKQLPDWAISAIALSALFGGLLGGRSQVASQIIQHIVAIVALIAGQIGRYRANGSNVKPDEITSNDSSQSPTIVDEFVPQNQILQMIPTTISECLNKNDEQGQSKEH